MSEQKRLFWIRVLLALFVVSLVVSGATAIPLEWELNLVTRWVRPPVPGDSSAYAAFACWIWTVRDAVADTNGRYPFLAYGTDWLAFGHFAIALAFIGPIRDPVRNVWVITFGMVACALVVPYAMIFGELRAIPFGWRVIDSLFGLVGFPLLWLARRHTYRLPNGRS